MDVFLSGVISSFVLFAVVLPLFGLAVGLFSYYVLPYVFGGIVTFVLLLAVGVKIFFALWAWVIAVLWASAVFVVKMKYRKLGEEIEHYKAAHATLLCGWPYRRMRNELREAYVGEIEI